MTNFNTLSETSDDFHIELNKQYWWLHVPVLSWVGLVFPLILPPIPVGPIVFSLSWNRREWMSHLRRGMASIGRKRKEYSFPLGWFVNVGVNLIDLASFGLSHLFVTAQLLSKMIHKKGSEQERAEIDPVMWVLKWLVLGNVVFLALYIVYPGYIFGKLLTRFERHLYYQYKPAKGMVKSKTSPELQVAYQSVTTFDELARMSQETPVLLFSEHIPFEVEALALQEFQKTLENIAANLIEQGVSVCWCNTNLAAPSRYHDIADYLKQISLDKRGWTLFDKSEMVTHRSTEGIHDEDKLANIARETLGLPQAVIVSQNRIGSPDCTVTSLEQVTQKSMTAPVILVVFSASSEQETQVTLDIRNHLLPQIRPWLDAFQACVCLANTHKKINHPIRNQVDQIQRKFHGVMLFEKGEIIESRKFGTFSGWNEYAKQIKKWFPEIKVAPSETGLTEIDYFVVNSLQEARNYSYQRPAVLLFGQFNHQAEELKEFQDNILPDIWPQAQEKASILCCTHAIPLDSQFQSDARTPLSPGVVLLRDGHMVVNKRIKPCPGIAVKYVSAVREVLQLIRPVAYENAPAA